MLKNFHLNARLVSTLKCLLISYLLTTGLLLLMALLLYRVHLSEKLVSIGIIIIYVLVTFVSGFITGKREGNRKFLWGLLSGILYFAVLLILSVIFSRELNALSGNTLTVLILCGGGGMLGGMLS